MALQQQVTFQADIEKALANFEIFNKKLLSTNATIKTLEATVAQFNSKGALVGIGFEGTLRTGEKISGVARQVAGSFQIAGAQIRNTISEYKRLDDAARGYLLTLKDVARISEATFVKQGISAFNDALRDGIRNALQFQIAISEIRTISQRSQLSFSTWSSEIKKVSDQLGLPIADVAEANYEALSNQIVKGAQSFEFLKKAGDFARTTQASLTQSTNLLSSAFNAYNIDVSEAERVSAVFFKTIDLGRLRAGEIADTFGRVAFLGNTLGVTFEEVNAGLATLTVQGVKASDAQTLLTNIFQKLLRPTERMKAVFKEFGVSTGQAAIQTFGFAGVLQKLIDLAKKGDVDVGELFNEIRGRKGFEGLSNFQGQFANNLQQITNSVTDYRRAVEIRGESPADFLIKEANKLKNTLNESFGQPVIALTADYVKELKNIGPEFDIIQSLAEAAAKGLFVYAAAALAGTVATRALTLAALKNPFTLLTAGVALYGSKLIELRDKTVEYTGTLKRLQDEIKDQGLSGIGGSGKAQKDFELLRDKANETYRSILQNVAIARSGIDSNLDHIRNKTSIINDSLKNSFKSYFDTLNEGIQKTQQRISQFETNINQSKNAVQDFQTSTKEIVFQSKFEFATPLQQRQLIGEKIKELENDAVRLAAQNVDDPQRAQENAKEVNDNLKRAAELIRQDQQIIVEIQKAAAQAQGYTGPIVVNSLENNVALNRVLELQRSLNDDIQKQQEKRLEGLRAEKKAQEEKFIALQALTKEFQDFGFLNKDNNPKPEFRDPLSGQLDPERALKAFEQLTGRLRDSIGNDANAQINLLNLIEAKKMSILREAELTKSKFLTDAAVKNLENQKKFGQQEIEAARTRASQAAGSVFGQGGALERLSETDALKKFAGRDVLLSDDINSFVKDFAKGQAEKGVELQRNKDIAASRIKFLSEVEGFNKAVERARTQTDEFGGFKAVSPEQIIELRERVNRLKDTFGNLLKAREGADKNPLEAALKPNDGGAPVPFGDILTDLTRSIDALVTGRKDVITGIGLQNTAQSQLNKVADDPILKQLKDQIPQIANEVDAAGPRIKSQFNSVNEAVGDTLKTVRELQKELQNLNLPPLGNKRSSLDSFNPFGSDSVYASTGGVIGLHPGSPRGTDIVPAWLTPGERVLSVAQNRQYEQMATLLRPFQSARYYKQGGVVTTTVGDINISVSGAKGAQPLQQIAKGLRRGIKRGSIKLS